MSFSRFAVFFLFLGLCGSDLVSQPLLLRIRKEDSLIGFSINKWGVFKEEGRFRDFDGTVRFDPGNLAATTVDIAINAASIDSRNEGRDNALRSEEFFHVSQFPTLRFKSTGVTVKNPSTILVRGEMTIRGVTKVMEIPVTISGVNHAGGKLGTLVGFESQFTIDREDFGVGMGWSIIDREAHIHLLIGTGSNVTASR